MNIIIEAAYHNQWKIIKNYLEAGGDIESTDDEGNTALTIAALEGKVKLFKKLIAHGANTQHKNSRKESVFLATIFGQNFEIVKCIIDDINEIDMRDGNDDTPLMVAASLGNLKIVKLLVDHGADLNAVSKASDYTPLLDALQKGHEEVAKYLIAKGANVITMGKDRNTPLMYAVDQNMPELALLLIEKGCDIKTKSKDGIGALFGATVIENTKLIDVLLEKGLYMSTNGVIQHCFVAP